MARNLIKTLFLLMITLITTGLLVFCLASNWWIKINEASLEQVQAKHQREYSAFSDNLRLDEKMTSVLKESKQTLTSTTTAAPATISASSTTPAVSKAKTTTDDYDYGTYDDTYDNNFSDADKEKKRLKRSESRGLLFYSFSIRPVQSFFLIIFLQLLKT
jgi:hypothetical protein